MMVSRRAGLSQELDGVVGGVGGVVGGLQVCLFAQIYTLIVRLL